MNDRIGVSEVVFNEDTTVIKYYRLGEHNDEILIRREMAVRNINNPELLTFITEAVTAWVEYAEDELFGDEED